MMMLLWRLASGVRYKVEAIVGKGMGPPNRGDGYLLRWCSYGG